MIINRTYHRDRTFGCRIETEVRDEAPIKVHIGTMVDGWLDPAISVDLTVANALNIIATLQELVDHADLVREEKRSANMKKAVSDFIASGEPMFKPRSNETNEEIDSRINAEIRAASSPINTAAEPPVTEFGNLKELHIFCATTGALWVKRGDELLSGPFATQASAKKAMEFMRKHEQMHAAVDYRIKQTIEDSGGGKTLVVELPDEDTVIANLEGYPQFTNKPEDATGLPDYMANRMPPRVELAPNWDVKEGAYADEQRWHMEAAIDEMWASMVNQPFEKQAEILREHVHQSDAMRRLIIPSKRFADWARANVAQLTGLATEIRS